MGAPDILTQLRAQGLSLTAEGGGTIRAEPRTALTDEARALIRDHKPALLTLLAIEARRQRVIALLQADPERRMAVITDIDSEPDHVIVTVGIRDQATADLAIPRSRYDGIRVLELIQLHTAQRRHA